MPEKFFRTVLTRVHNTDKVQEILFVQFPVVQIDRDSLIGLVLTLFVRGRKVTGSKTFTALEGFSTVQSTAAVFEPGPLVFLCGLVFVAACFGLVPIISSGLNSGFSLFLTGGLPLLSLT